MQNIPKIIASVIGAVVLIGIYQAQNSELLTLDADETILAGAANIIMVYFVLALLIERACEVAMDILTAAGAVAPKPTAGQDEGASDRRLVSLTICLLFAAFVTLAGLRLVEMILGVATTGDLQLAGYFAGADALLTCLFLAGGSEGVHQVMLQITGQKRQTANET